MWTGKGRQGHHLYHDESGSTNQCLTEGIKHKGNTTPKRAKAIHAQLAPERIDYSTHPQGVGFSAGNQELLDATLGELVWTQSRHILEAHGIQPENIEEKGKTQLLGLDDELDKYPGLGAIVIGVALLGSDFGSLLKSEVRGLIEKYIGQKSMV